MTDMADTPILYETRIIKKARDMAERDYEDYPVPEESLEGVNNAEQYRYPAVSEHGGWDTGRLPALRQLSGYGDRGHGTHTDGDRQVVFVPAENEDDEPCMGELVEARHIMDTVVEAYEERAYELMREAVNEALLKRGADEAVEEITD